jgi:hypothetical protein
MREPDGGCETQLDGYPRKNKLMYVGIARLTTRFDDFVTTYTVRTANAIQIHINGSCEAVVREPARVKSHTYYLRLPASLVPPRLNLPSDMPHLP